MNLKHHILFLILLLPTGLIFAKQDNLPTKKGTVLSAPKVSRSRFLNSNTQSTERIVFNENFEDAQSQWTGETVWEIGKPHGNAVKNDNSGRCAATNLAGHYPDNSDAKLVSPPISLPPLMQPNAAIKLTFQEWFQIESDYDYGAVSVSTDMGKNWNQLHIQHGSSGWRETELDLTPYQGTNIVLSFQFLSDAKYNYQGWYIDDIEIKILNEIFNYLFL